MKTVVFCPPGFERGTFTLGVLDYFQEKGFVIDGLIAMSTGAHAAVFFAAGLTKECIEEFSKFDMKCLTKPHSFWKRSFKLHTLPGLVRNEGFIEFIQSILKKHGVIERLKNYRQLLRELSVITVDLMSGDKATFEIDKCDFNECELAKILVASSSAVPLWPPVNLGSAPFIDGVYAERYFLDSVIKDPQSKFIICTGDTPGKNSVLAKKLNSLISIHMRTADLLCGQKINEELCLLERDGVLGKNVFVISTEGVLPRVGLFRKTKDDVAKLVNLGRVAAEEFLTRHENQKV